MVKYYENNTIFHYTWDQVVQGFWRRYPNPESKHVLSEDTIHREVKENKLFSIRLLTKTNRVPHWGERFIGSPIVKIIEESIIDPEKRTLTTYTRNLGYTKVMSLVEKVVYRPSEENPSWTIAERSAWVDSQVLGFGRAIQAFGVERFRKNCIKMVHGFNYVLSSMFPSSVSAHHSQTQLSTSTAKEKLKGAAKKASDLAKSKAGSLYITCEPTA
uniref:Putative preli domain-containing protein 1 mitochondrial n=1 Tax=Triatoma dimidiata TaxID=72491 RepID=A0A0V0G5E1_TRIDM